MFPRADDDGIKIATHAESNSYIYIYIPIYSCIHVQRVREKRKGEKRKKSERKVVAWSSLGHTVGGTKISGTPRSSGTGRDSSPHFRKVLAVDEVRIRSAVF